MSSGLGDALDASISQSGEVAAPSSRQRAKPDEGSPLRSIPLPTIAPISRSDLRSLESISCAKKSPPFPARVIPPPSAFGMTDMPVKRAAPSSRQRAKPDEGSPLRSIPLPTIAHVSRSDLRSLESISCAKKSPPFPARVIPSPSAFGMTASRRNPIGNCSRENQSSQ